MVEINLGNKKWCFKNNIRFIGHFYKNETLITGYGAIQYFERINTLDEFKSTISTLNGQFAIIIKKGIYFWLATDKIRSYPIFFFKESQKIIISDEASYCFGYNSEYKINKISVECFLRTGYTLNNNTLISNLFSCEPAQIVQIENSSWTINNYPIYPEKPDVKTDNFNALSIELNSLIDRIFKRLFFNLKTTPIAVSLSGGYDSRLIAAMAAKYHPQNLYFFSYGIKNHKELKLAEKVSEKLGVNWIFIEYNNKLIENFLNDPVFIKYYPFASNYSSMFYLQDYFALKELKEKKLVPDNCVFIPGHSGDALGGSHISKRLLNFKSGKKVLSEIFDYHFNFIKSSKKEKNKIIEEIRKSIPINLQINWKGLDYWYLYQRQPKFVINSCRVYSFFGYDYFLPLWDDELQNFFHSVPISNRINKKLYNSVLTNLFNEFTLNFKNELEPTMVEKKIKIIKQKIKRLLPHFIINLFTQRISPFFYHKITLILKNEIKPQFYTKPAQSNFYNAYIIQWYLQSLMVGEKIHFKD